MITVMDMLRRNAGLYADEVALVEVNPEVREPSRVTWRDFDLVQSTETEPYRREITWRVFDEKANRFANLLLSRGIGKGDKVAILLHNCLEWLPIYFGVLKTGAVAVPLNFRYTAAEIQYCVQKAEVEALVFGPEFTSRVEDRLGPISRNRLLFFAGGPCPDFAEDYLELSSNCPSLDPLVPVTLDEDGAIYYSSGTTGFPKAILHPHRSLSQAAEMEAVHHRTTHDDVFLCIPPLYHTGAKFHWMGSLFTGSRAVLLRGVSPRTVFEAVSNEGCTLVWLLVPWAQDILTAIEQGELRVRDYRLEQWRLMHIGAQPVPKSLIRRWKQIFPHHDYDTNYGLSESTGPGCVHLGLDNIEHVGAIGVPGYRWEAKVCSDGKGTEVPQGETGELWVKGPGVMRCYYNDPKATSETLRDGWLLTGDMARVDEEGFIWLVDRKKDVIIMGGENIYPVQIEDYLAGHPAIQDVAVIGVPDERLGEVSCAIIQLKRNHLDREGNPIDVTEQDIEDFCLDLPRYKRPRKVVFAPVPRNPTGKIEKPALRAKYGAENLVDRENRA